MPEPIEESQEKLYYDPLSVARRTSQVIHLVQDHDKNALLTHFIKHNEGIHLIVICKTKKGADLLCQSLQEQEIKALSVHSNISATQCQKALDSFNKKETNILIMTDMILQAQAQALDAITHIVSYNIPSEASYYYDRLKILEEKGEGISFVCEEEQHLMDAIQWAMKVEIVEVEFEGFIQSPKPELKENIKKDKTKKPRHKKNKTKKDIKKNDNE